MFRGRNLPYIDSFQSMHDRGFSMHMLKAVPCAGGLG